MFLTEAPLTEDSIGSVLVRLTGIDQFLPIGERNSLGPR